MKIRKSDLEKLLVELGSIYIDVLKLPHEPNPNMMSLAIGGHICMIKERIKMLLNVESMRGSNEKENIEK